MIQNEPGFTWCPDCKQHIPDILTDHFDRHRAVAEPLDESGDAIAFWAMCLALGAVAAVVVAAIIPL